MIQFNCNKDLLTMLRFGLCCKFYEEPIRFKEVRFIHYDKLGEQEKIDKIDEVIFFNMTSLLEALKYCYKSNIFSFRIGSALFPLYTHPQVNYTIDSLPRARAIKALIQTTAQFAKKQKIRLTFHPDQFVILNSPREEVVEAAVRDLKYHNMLAELLGADVINIHAGGVYGDKLVALKRLKKNIQLLPREILEKLTLENDDKSYTPQDLYPLCRELKIPLVYDVHHHRCLPDEWGEAAATHHALQTWDREPLFHISSPKEGWQGPKPARHHDYIDVQDFPEIWKDIHPLTVDIEAKAKELAIFKLMADMNFFQQG